MENYATIRKDPNVLELIDSVNFIAIVINRQRQLFWSFLCIIINVFFRIVSLFSDKLQKSMKDRARFLRLRLHCIHFSVTFINRRLRRFWTFLCRSFIAISHIMSTVSSRIVSLFGVMKNYYFLLKSPFYQLRKSMDKPDRFPLLNLDYVSIREVLNTLDPIDYINFSKASKSCRRLSTCKKPYKVELNFMNSPKMWFRNGSFISGMKWGKSITQIFRSTRVEPLDAMKEFYLVSKSVMDFEVHSVTIFMDDCEGQCREIVDWLRSNCPEFSVLIVDGNYQRTEDLQYIVDNLKVKDWLHTCVKTIEELPLEIPKTVGQLSIMHGSWITLDYIMSLKMRMMAFHHTKLTNQDINVFYKSWIEMKSHQNLGCFEINLTNLDGFIAVALRDIPYEMGHYPDCGAVVGPFKVTRKDGLTASICAHEYVTGFVATMFTTFYTPRRDIVPYFG